MTTREFDPLRLDVPAFAKQAGHLDGRWALATFARVTESASTEAPVVDDDEVVWSARGESRPARGGESEPWLHLHARTRLALVCQRCLGPVETPLEVERHFLFVHGEDAAALLDESSDDDVLAMTRALDLRELVEDELLLAMPLVPRHEVCPVTLVLPGEVAEEEEAAAHPFAVLAALKRDPRPN